MGCVVLDEFLYVLGGTNRHNEVLQVSQAFLTAPYFVHHPLINQKCYNCLYGILRIR